MTQAIPDKPLRIVVWSTGTIGKLLITGVDAHPDLELVGVWTSTPTKNGKDAGELAGLGRELGVKATTDKDELIALAPDAILHGAMTDDRIFDAIADLTGFLEAGINVISSGPVLLLHPRGTFPDAMIDPIEDAARRGKATLHVNGIDPGFANDLLPLVFTSLSQRIDHIRVSEIADYSTYYQPVVMRDLFGFGQPMESKPIMWEPGILTSAWGPVVRIIADGLGVELDPDLVEKVERRAADHDYKTVSVDVATGTMGSVRFQVTGTVNGEPRVTLDHVTRTDPESDPDWPRPLEGDGCYRVEITGEPMMKVDFTHHGENGDHNVSGMVTTAQRLVNAVPAVVAAEPGIVSVLDLPLVTGRGLVTR